ncbi:MAG: hypothetical protein LKF33_06170 [Prevotella sp.]|jgi:hypothetical protein|nr:hypothetical protein [Prevotella sp.]
MNYGDIAPGQVMRVQKHLKLNTKKRDEEHGSKEIVKLITNKEFDAACIIRLNSSIKKS